MTVLAHAGAADESLAVAMIFVALWVGWIGWSRLRGTGFPGMPRWGGQVLLGAAVAMLVAAAIVPGALFGPTPSPAEPMPAAEGERPSSDATLSFAEPADGATVEGDQLEVVLELTGGRIIETSSLDLRPDEGHVHLTLDGEIVSMTFGTVQVLPIGELPPGQHTLVAEFVAADHSPFAPRVATAISFEKGGA